MDDAQDQLYHETILLRLQSVSAYETMQAWLQEEHAGGRWDEAEFHLRLSRIAGRFHDQQTAYEETLEQISARDENGGK